MKCVDGFTVIAEPTRRRIIDTLRSGNSDVSSLIRRLEVSQSLLSKHLRVLRDAGVVESCTDGKRRVYRLAEDPLPDVLAWVEPYHRRWAASFDALAAAPDTDHPAPVTDTDTDTDTDEKNR